MKNEKRAKDSENFRLKYLEKKKRCTNNNISQSNDLNGSKPTKVLDRMFMHLCAVSPVYSVVELQSGDGEWF